MGSTSAKVLLARASSPTLTIQRGPHVPIASSSMLGASRLEATKLPLLTSPAFVMVSLKKGLECPEPELRSLNSLSPDCRIERLQGHVGGCFAGAEPDPAQCAPAVLAWSQLSRS